MIRNPWRSLTAGEMLAKQLADAECERVSHQAAAEDYSFQVLKLNARIARIKQELQAITHTPNHEDTKE